MSDFSVTLKDGRVKTSAVLFREIHIGFQIHAEIQRSLHNFQVSKQMRTYQEPNKLTNELLTHSLARSINQSISQIISQSISQQVG